MFGWKNREIRELRAEVREARERATATERRRADVHLDEVRREHARQCKQLADDVMKWQRKAVDAEAGAKRVASQNRVLRERLEALHKDSGLQALDAEYEVLDQRHHRAKLRIVRYVSELRGLRGTVADQAEGLRTQGKRISVLEKQLDAATGMDHPDIEAGAGWQARRPDRHVPLYAQSPSAPLPTREPGEVTS